MPVSSVFLQETDICSFGVKESLFKCYLVDTEQCIQSAVHGNFTRFAPKIPVSGVLTKKMETILGLCTVLSVPLYYGVKHFLYIYEPFSRSHWGIFQGLSLILLLLYCILILKIGCDALYALSPQNPKKAAYFLQFFIIPSVGFAFSLFPKIAVENFKVETELVMKWLNIPALIGWLIVLNLLVTIVV